MVSSDEIDTLISKLEEAKDANDMTDVKLREAKITIEQILGEFDYEDVLDEALTHDDGLDIERISADPLHGKDLFEDGNIPNPLEVAEHTEVCSGGPSLFRGEDVSDAVNNVLFEIARLRHSTLASADGPVERMYLDRIETVIRESFADVSDSLCPQTREFDVAEIDQ